MVDFTINGAATHQTIEGFGGSDSFQANYSIPLLDLFFTTNSTSFGNGIGLTYLRTTGPSPTGTIYPPGSFYNPQQAIARGAKWVLSPLSPPGAWKTNGTSTNGGTLLTAHYADWANVLATFVGTTAPANGLSVYAISCQNEPDTTATYDSCLYVWNQLASFAATALAPAIAASGSPSTIILGPEDQGWGGSLGDIDLILNNAPSQAAVFGRFITHQYSPPEAPHRVLPVNLWQTEFSTFDAFDPTIVNGISYAKAVFDGLVTGNATLWFHWTLNAATIAFGGGGDNEGLVGQTSDTVFNSPTLTKRLYTFGQFSRFVRPGSVRIDVAGSVSGVSVASFATPATNLPIVVLINSNTSPVSTSLSLTNVATPDHFENWLTSASSNLQNQGNISVASTASLSLPAQSVTTLNPVGAIIIPPSNTTSGDRAKSRLR
jgi:glucuronoarabinoxylan endo-1,4-beta-xylanase